MEVGGYYLPDKITSMPVVMAGDRMTRIGEVEAMEERKAGETAE